MHFTATLHTFYSDFSHILQRLFTHFTVTFHTFYSYSSHILQCQTRDSACQTLFKTGWQLFTDALTNEPRGPSLIREVITDTRAISQDALLRVRAVTRGVSSLIWRVITDTRAIIDTAGHH